MIPSKRLEYAEYALLKPSIKFPSSRMTLNFNDRLESALEMHIGRVYDKFLKYFNIVAQVHSIAITGRNNAYLRVWCGEKMGPEASEKLHKQKMYRMHKEIFQRWLSPPFPPIAKAVNRLGKEYLIEIDVYEDHKEALNFIKSGDFVVLYNVHYSKTRFSEGFILHGGKKYNRGVFRIPNDYENDKFQAFRKLIGEKIDEAKNDEEFLEFDAEVPTHLYSKPISHFKFPSENCEAPIDFVKPNNKIVIGDNLISVDYFTFAGNSKYYFLTHAHSDHFKNLTSKWRKKVFCSETTAAILPTLTESRNDGGIDPSLLHPLEVGVTHAFNDFKVTLLDANHCAGAVMFLFEGEAIPGGAVLCTGDFRADSKLIKKFEEDENFINLKELRLSTIYFDNTYLHTEKKFPDREEAAVMLFQELKKFPSHHIYFPMHRLGREKLIEKISNTLQEPICVYSLKKKVIEKLGCYCTYGRSTDRKLIVVEKNKWKTEESLHHSMVFDISMMNNFVVADNRSRNVNSTSHIVHIPYSDHSSRYEIIDFLKHLNYRKLVPIARKIDVRVLKFLLTFSTCTKDQKIGRTATPPPPHRLLKDLPRDVLIDDDSDEDRNKEIRSPVSIQTTSSLTTTPTLVSKAKRSNTAPSTSSFRTPSAQAPTQSSPLKRKIPTRSAKRSEIAVPETSIVQEEPSTSRNAQNDSRNLKEVCQRWCPEGFRYINDLPPPKTKEEAIEWMLFTPELVRIDSE